MADDLEEYDMEQDKFMPGKGGKGRSKLEASTHTNHHDPGGQTRKIVTKMQNTEKNRAEAGGDKGPAQKKTAPAEDNWARREPDHGDATSFPRWLLSLRETESLKGSMANASPVYPPWSTEP